MHCHVLTVKITANTKLLYEFVLGKRGNVYSASYQSAFFQLFDHHTPIGELELKEHQKSFYSLKLLL